MTKIKKSPTMLILLAAMIFLAGCNSVQCLGDGCKVQFKLPFKEHLVENEKAILYNYCRCQSTKDKKHRDKNYKKTCKGVL